MNTDGEGITSICVDQRASAVILCAESGVLADSLKHGHVYMFTINRMRGTCSKKTGQIQNREDFFGLGIAGVPPRICVKRGLEIGARVRGGILRVGEFIEMLGSGR
jgi:hypothetical protein